MVGGSFRLVVVAFVAGLLLDGCRGAGSQSGRDGGSDAPAADHIAPPDADAAVTDAATEPSGFELGARDAGLDVAVADAAAPDTRSDAGGGDSAPLDVALERGSGDTVAPRPLVWRSITVPGLGSEWVYAIWGSGPTEVYVGTSTNKVLHRSAGGAWSAQTLPGTRGIYWIWGSGPNDVYASTGDSGVLYHSTGTDVWTPVALPDTYFGFPAQATSVRGIWGLSATEVFVAGSITYTLSMQTVSTGVVFHLKDGVWTIGGVSQNNTMYQVWASGPTDVYAIGGIGESLYRSRGDDMWKNERVGNGNNMGALWGADASNVFVVVTTYNRNMGPIVVYHSGGSGPWTPELSMATYDIGTAWGSGPDDVYVGGIFRAESSSNNVGVLYHRTGGQWTAVDLSAVPRLFAINVVWGSSASNVYVGGRFDDPLNGALLQATSN